MKKLLLMKTVLLLFALVVGSSNVWADPTVKTESWTFNGSDTWTTGVSKYCGCYGQKGNSTTVKNASISNFSSVDFSTVTSPSVTIYVTGLTNNGTNSYTVSLVDKDGNDIGTAQTKTDGLGTGTNASSASESSVTITPVKGATGYRITVPAKGALKGTRYSLSYTELSYTISAAVNNPTMGSASVDGTTITAAPNDGYRVANGDDGYTVTSGTATVSHTGYSNTLSVTPTSDCTVRINFEAIPTHTITCVADPVGAGTFDAVSSLYEGGTTEIEATANSGYKFTGWSVSGTGASLSSDSDNPTTLTMGTANVTVTATFEAITTYAISYSVNGSVVKTVNVEENKAVDLSAPASGIPAGYTFKGWVVEANKIDTPTDTDPKANYVTSATSTADITYFAVMGVVSGNDVTSELTGSSITSEFGTHAYADDEESEIIDGLTWTFRGSRAATNPWMQIRSNETASYIKIASSKVIKRIYLQISNASNSSGGVNDITKHGDFAGTVYLESSYQSSPSGALASSTVAASEKAVTIDIPNSTAKEVYIQVSTSARIWDIIATYDNSITFNYCTSLPANVSITPAKPYTTLTSKYPLDFTSSDLKAFIATEIADSKVQMTQVNKVPANTGLVLKATSTGSAINVPVLSGAADDVTDNKMAGSAFSTTAVAANAGYILSGGVFQPSSGGDLPAGKAYLNIAVGAGARALEMNFDDDVTAIEAVKAQNVENGQYFNLAGQRVAQPTKGLYIVNGKKVIIK